MNTTQLITPKNNEEKSSTNIAHYKSKNKRLVLLFFHYLLNMLGELSTVAYFSTGGYEIKGFTGDQRNPENS